MKFFNLKLPVLVASLFFMSLLSCKNNSTNQNEQTFTAEEAAVPADSVYMGLDREILKRLAVDQIPADFPQHVEGETKAEFRHRGILWAKENRDLVTPKFRAKLDNYQE